MRGSTQIITGGSATSGGSATFATLGGAPGDNAALAAALAAKLDKAGGTMTGALTISTTGTGLTVGSGAAGSSIGIRGTGTTLLMTVGFGDSVSIGGQVSATGGLSMTGGSLLGRNAAAGVYMPSAGQIGFGSSVDNTGTNDAFLVRAAAASLQLGSNHATTATEQTIKAHNVTTGTGANLVLAGGTGSVMGGSVKIAASTTTGAPNTLIEVMPSDQLAFFGTGGSTQPNTGLAGESHVAGSGTAVTEDSTFGGYTLMQVVAGLRALGLFQ